MLSVALAALPLGACGQQNDNPEIGGEASQPVADTEEPVDPSGKPAIDYDDP